MDWRNYVRDVLVDYFLKNSSVIYDKGNIVEVSISMLTNHCRMLDEGTVLVFGCMDTTRDEHCLLLLWQAMPTLFSLHWQSMMSHLALYMCLTCSTQIPIDILI